MYWYKFWLSSAQLWICTFVLPGPGRGRLSSLAGVSRKRAAALQETPTGRRRPGNPASSVRFLPWTLRSPCRYVSLVYHSREGLFLFSRCLYLKRVGNRNLWTRSSDTPNYASSLEFFFQKTSDRSHLMNSQPYPFIRRSEDAVIWWFSHARFRRFPNQLKICTDSVICFLNDFLFLATQRLFTMWELWYI